MAPIGRPTIWAARTLPPTTSTAKPTIVCRMSTHVTTHATTPKTRPQWMPVAGIVPIIRRSPMAHDAGLSTWPKSRMGPATRWFRPRSATKPPKTPRAASRAAAEMAAVSAHAAPRTRLLLEAGLADGALDQEVHRQLELVVVVGDDLTLFEDDVALVVLQGAFVELERVVDEALLHREDLRPELRSHRPAERAQRDHVLLEAAA